MKYRIIPSKKRGKKLEAIQDPEGENPVSLGTFETIQAAKSAVRAIVLSRGSENVSD